MRSLIFGIIISSTLSSFCQDISNIFLKKESTYGINLVNDSTFNGMGYSILDKNIFKTYYNTTSKRYVIQYRDIKKNNYYHDNGEIVIASLDSNKIRSMNSYF